MFGFRYSQVVPILILLLGEVLSSPFKNTLENRKGRQDDGDEDGDAAPQEFLGPPDRPTIPPRIGLLPQVGQLVAHFAKGNQNFGTNLTSFVGTATSLLPGNLGGQVFNVLKIFTGDNNKKIKPDPIPGSVPGGFAPAPVPGHATAPAVPALPITDDPLLREINILSQFKPSELKLLAENGNLNHISPDALFVFGITLKPTSVNSPTAKPEKLEFVPLPTSFSFPTIKTPQVDFDDEVGFGLGPTLGPVKTKTRPPPPPSTAAPVPAEAQDIKLFLEISEATQPPAPKPPPLFSLPVNLLEPGRERPKPTPKPWKEVPGSADNLFSNVLLANDLLRPKEPLNFQNSEIPVGSTQQKPISVSYVEQEETTVLPAKYTVNKRRKPPSVHQEQAALQAEQLKLLQQAGSLLKPEVTESPVEQDELKQTYSKPKQPTTTTPQPAFSSQWLSQHNQFLPPEHQIQQQQQQQQQNPQFNRFGRPRPPFRGPFERPPPGFNIDEDEDSDENDLKGSKEEKRKPE